MLCEKSKSINYDGVQGAAVRHTANPEAGFETSLNALRNSPCLPAAFAVLPADRALMLFIRDPAMVLSIQHPDLVAPQIVHPP